MFLHGSEPQLTKITFPMTYFMLSSYVFQTVDYSYIVRMTVEIKFHKSLHFAVIQCILSVDYSYASGLTAKIDFDTLCALTFVVTERDWE